MQAARSTSSPHKRSFVDVIAVVLHARNDESGNLLLACASTSDLAERAHVIIPDVSNTLPRLATERVVKKRVATWHEGDGAHWMLQVE